MSDPQERSRPITFLAFMVIACLLLGRTASAAPSTALSKKSGPPTSKILVAGRGFENLQVPYCDARSCFWGTIQLTEYNCVATSLGGENQ
jgi:hypothetical protein